MKGHLTIVTQEVNEKRGVEVRYTPVFAYSQTHFSCGKDTRARRVEEQVDLLTSLPHTQVDSNSTPQSQSKVSFSPNALTYVVLHSHSLSQSG